MSLGFLGFKPTIVNLIFCCVNYSVYLTISKIGVLLYFICLCTGFINGLYQLASFDRSDDLMIFVINIALYLILGYFVITRYWSYRKVDRYNPGQRATLDELKEGLLTKRRTTGINKEIEKLEKEFKETGDKEIG